MMPSEVPLIDVSSYLVEDASQEARASVIDQVKRACEDFGFLQVKGHGVPVATQRGMLDSCKTLFALPQQKKDDLSLKNNPARRQVSHHVSKAAWSDSKQRL
jgi:isopenicillin N synthase-like dioxygenase